MQDRRRLIVSAAALLSLACAADCWGNKSNISETASGSPGNTNYVYTYSPDGTQLAAIAIPVPPAGYDQPHNLVVDKAGNLQVVYGSGPYLSTYNGTSWTFHTALNYNIGGTTYSGAVATYNNYVWVQSQAGGSGVNGIIRFDTANNYSTSITQLPDPVDGGYYIPSDVTMGMNGRLCVTYYIGAGGDEVVQYDPNTMAILQTTILATGSTDGDHSVIDTQGNIYTIGRGYFNKYSAAGVFVKGFQYPNQVDLAISSDNVLLTTQSNIAYQFDTDLNQIGATPIHSAYWGDPMIAWDTYQTPVPEPGEVHLLLAGAVACAMLHRPRGRRLA